MSNRTSLIRIAVPACAVLALAACSDTPSDDEAIDALTESFESEDGSGPALASDDARCVATDIVEALGAERVLEIEESDLDGNLPQSEAAAVSSAFVDCVDLKAFFSDVFAEDPQLAVFPTTFTDCLIDEIGDDALATALEAQFSGEGDADAMAESLGADAGEACFAVLTPEEIDEIANS